MRFHVLQHVPFEGLGSISPWLQTAKATVAYTRFFRAESLPDLGDVEAVVILGGPMSVHDEADYPWLRDEKQFVREALLLERPVLGICLGAQLMASALGARVYAAAEKEIGWHLIQACPGDPGVFPFPASAKVFHWHGETFDLPVGAKLLARSEGCLHQAFQVGPRAMALQFHLETTVEGVDALLANSRHEMVPARFVQCESDMRSVPPVRYVAANRIMNEVLSYVTRLIA
jgi:GMP synthase-like glutamine amidotransferase